MLNQLLVKLIILIYWDDGCKDADLLIAVSENDESNIIACEMAKILFNVPNTITRIKEKELLKEKWLDLF